MESTLCTLRAELGALIHSGWEIRMNEIVPACIPSVGIGMAESCMPGPLMNPFLSCHSWLVLGWNVVSRGQRSTVGMGLPLHVQAVEPLNAGVITIIIKH